MAAATIRPSASPDDQRPVGRATEVRRHRPPERRDLRARCIGFDHDLHPGVGLVVGDDADGKVGGFRGIHLVRGRHVHVEAESWLDPGGGVSRVEDDVADHAVLREERHGDVDAAPAAR